MGNDYQIWIVTLDANGGKVPYEMVGGASTRELAEAILKATVATGYDAVILRG